MTVARQSSTIQLRMSPRLDSLEACERVIERGLGSFLEVGRALQAIKAKPEWIKAEYGTFDQYVQQRWEFQKRYANRVIAATEVVKTVGPLGPTPLTETQARPLTTLKTPEEQRAVWARVVEEAGDKPVTAALVERVLEAWQQERAATVPDPEPEEPEPEEEPEEPEPEEAEEAEGGGFVDYRLTAATDLVAGATESEPEPEPELSAVVVPALVPSSVAVADFYDVPTWKALPKKAREAIIAAALETRSRPTFNWTNENVDWAAWTWNPVTGCEHDCDYCYARDLANRYYDELPDGRRFDPFLRPGRLIAPRRMKIPSGYDPGDPATIGLKNVFVGSMADLFGKWVPQDWIDAVFKEVEGRPDWNFLFLTKFPQRLAQQDWPDNAWVGTTVDIQARVRSAQRAFGNVKAGVRWLSCEPLLERLTFTDLSMFDWVVIGACSKNTQTPEIQPHWEWVEHLKEQADRFGCKVYEKPNLHVWRREYPEEVRR